MDIVAKLFVLGSPGSGKSTVIRSVIEPLVKSFQYTPEHINDYEILRTMFLDDLKKDKKDRWFAASEYNGFNVLNFIAFDLALKCLEKQTRTLFAKKISDITRPSLAIIEFSRNNHRRAFDQFSRAFLQDAYFIYLDTTIANCKRRIHTRIEKPSGEKTEDDYYVPNHIFETYYKYKEGHPLTETLQKFGINKQNILIVDNNVTQEIASQKIQAFTGDMMENLILKTRSNRPAKTRKAALLARA